MSQKYVALLRGINVSGQKLIKMEALRNALQQLPITNISTYIQSGNVLFESSSTDILSLQQQIHELIRLKFGFDVTVIVVTSAELDEIINNNPFLNIMPEDSAQPYVTILSEKPSAAALEKLQEIDFGNDRWISHDRWLYIWYESAGKTKLTNSVIERKFKVQATSRNWKTVNKLLELLQVT